jgi:hypothetical protein
VRRVAGDHGGQTRTLITPWEPSVGTPTGEPWSGRSHRRSRALVERLHSGSARLGPRAALAPALGALLVALVVAASAVFVGAVVSADAAAGAGQLAGTPLQLLPVHGTGPVRATITAGARRWGKATLVNVSTDLRLTVALQGDGTAGAWFSPVPALVELGPGQYQSIAFGIAPPDDQHGTQHGSLVARIVGARAVAGGDSVVVHTARVALEVDIDVVPRVPITTARVAAASTPTTARIAVEPVSSAAGQRADLIMALAIAAGVGVIACSWFVWPRVRARRVEPDARGDVVALDVTLLNDALARRTGMTQSKRTDAAPGPGVGSSRSVPRVDRARPARVISSPPRS